MSSGIGDFRDTIRKNNRKTIVVISIFVGLYIFLGLLIDIYLFYEHYSGEIGKYLSFKNKIDRLLDGYHISNNPPYITFALACFAVLAVLVTFKFNDKLMLAGTTSREITKSNTQLDSEEKRLFNIVEELKLSAGMNYMPKVFIVEENYANAFASGYSEESAMIVVTRRLVSILDRSELQAVVAHELTHIRNNDIKLTLFSSVLANIMVIILDVAFGRVIYNRRIDARIKIVVIVLRFVVPFVAYVLMMYLSRTREYMADAGAVELMRDNQPMVNALKKINNDYVDNESEINLPEKDEVRRASYIFNINSINSFRDPLSNLFSTHPDLSERINVLTGVEEKNHKPFNKKELLLGAIALILTGVLISHYYNVNWNEKDYKQIVQSYEWRSLTAVQKASVIKSSFAKDKVAQYDIAIMYFLGNEIIQDYIEAEKWFIAAAEQGHAESQFMLGHIYSNGLSVDVDHSEAAKWYQLAADKGNMGAQNNLGLIYVKGTGVQRDYGEAIRLFRLAADQGDSEAQHNLGLMFVRGLGVEVDYEKAKNLYKLAADQGHAEAKKSLNKLISFTNNAKSTSISSLGNDYMYSQKLESDTSIQVLGVGQGLCNMISKQLRSNQQASTMTYGGWLHGYLTGMNQVAMMQQNPQLNISANQSWKAIVNHCANNPDDSLIIGANKLRQYLLSSGQQGTGQTVGQ